MNPKISIIILDFDGANDTIACVESLLLSVEKNFNLIIIENGSDEDNFKSLYKWCLSKFDFIHTLSDSEAESTIIEDLSFSKRILTFIKNSENFGFAIANNIGARFALLNGSEQILLLNNDTIVTPDFLDELSMFSIKYPEYVALTPMICLAEPKNIIWNCGGKVTWFGNRRYFYSGSDISQVPKIAFSEITFITGCALFFKPHRTGFLTEEFFFGEEDFEFSLRLLRKKQKMACVYSSLIYHKVGSSIKRDYDLIYNRLFVHYASRLINHKKYYSKIFRMFIKGLHLAYGFYLTFVRHKYGLNKSLRFWHRVNIYSNEHDKITKMDFFDIMHLSF
jgi:GT2 family glycosyltransferase